MLMAERDNLISRDPLIRLVGRPVYNAKDVTSEGYDERRAKERALGDRVHALMENLRH